MKYEPREPQRLATDFMLQHPKCAVWASMGVGKTAAALDAIQQRINNGDVKKGLIIAPKRVASAVWPNEIIKWDCFDLDFQLIAGTPSQRMQQFNSPAPIHIINFELFSWLVDLGRELSEWPYDMIVVDEASRMRTPSAVKFRAIRKVLQYTDHLVELTGTPAPNGLVHLWGQLYLLDRGERLFNTRGKFLERWFIHQEFSHKWVPVGVADKEISEKINDICLTIEDKDYFDVGKPININVPVTLSSEIMEQYRELENEMFLEFEDGEELEVFNPGVLTNKCRQFINGFVFTEHGVWRQIHDNKIAALDRVIEEANGMPVLVVYNFIPDKNRILQQYPNAELLDNKNSSDTIERWNRGEIPMLVVHPDSAGHGLNLQYGSNITVWFGMTWDLEQYEQTNARLGPMRQLQSELDRPSYVYHIIVEDTIDTIIQDRLESKCSVQDAIKKAAKKNKN